MNPDLSLGIVTPLAGFVLKTAVAFGVCLALSWLAESPGRRFTVWSIFLYGSTLYWLWLARGVFGQASGKPLPAYTPATLTQRLTSGAGTLQIPGSWIHSLGVALQVIGAFYLLVLVYLTVMHIRKHLQLQWILKFATQPPAEIRNIFEPLAERFRVRHSRLLMLSGITSPATFGCFRPTIVLPDVCLSQDHSQLEDILRHELQHVRRRDFVWNSLAIGCRAVLFFHPAAWYSVRRMQFDRELACDAAVTSDSPEERARYAECLIQFARLHSSQHSGNWGIDFAASSAHLKARVHSILAPSRKASRWLVWARAGCGLVLLTGLAGLEPSMGVLLTYARQQTTPPLTAEISTTPRRTATQAKPIRRGRVLTRSLPGVSASESAPGNVATDLPPERDPRSSTSSQSSSGPQLLHRGSSVSPKRDPSQTVVLIDNGSGQTAASGDHDRKQAVQQTATAALGIYKRLSALDRH